MVEIDVDDKTFSVLDDLKTGVKTPDYYVSKKDWLKSQGIDTNAVDQVLAEKVSRSDGNIQYTY